MKKKVVLACVDCHSRNYSTTKTITEQSIDRLEVKKYCKNCNAHTFHRETK